MRPYGGALLKCDFRIHAAVITAYSGFKDFCPLPNHTDRRKYWATVKEELREVAQERGRLRLG